MNADILSLFEVMDGGQTLIQHSSADLATSPLLPVQHSPPFEQFFSQILKEGRKIIRKSSKPPRSASNWEHFFFFGGFM